jgi:hypothetical protein
MLMIMRSAAFRIAPPTVRRCSAPVSRLADEACEALP